MDWYQWADKIESPPISDLIESIVFWIMIGSVTFCLAAFIIHLKEVNHHEG